MRKNVTVPQSVARGVESSRPHEKHDKRVQRLPVLADDQRPTTDDRRLTTNLTADADTPNCPV